MMKPGHWCCGAACPVCNALKGVRDAMSAPVTLPANWHHGPPMDAPPQFTTLAEKVVSDHLADAWNAYRDLRAAEGGSGDDLEDFRRSIDQCHMLISHRLAARVDPNTWR